MIGFEAGIAAGDALEARLTGSSYAHNVMSMAIMTIRTTVAFDPGTVARWERLAQK